MKIQPKVLDIKVLLAKKGYTLRGFSKELNISASYLSDVLNLKVNPSSKYARKITDALNVPFDEIFEIEEE